MERGWLRLAEPRTAPETGTLDFACRPPAGLLLLGKTSTPPTNSRVVAIMTPTVTPAHLDQYDTRGFFVLERVIPGDIIEVVAGNVVVFPALTLHGSGANSTQAPRRALNIAYT